MAGGHVTRVQLSAARPVQTFPFKASLRYIQNTRQIQIIDEFLKPDSYGVWFICQNLKNSLKAKGGDFRGGSFVQNSNRGFSVYR